MEINFDQVRAAAHDDIAAKILREKWQLDDRSSASGAVVCDHADIERLLASGRLEPVLSVEQFVRISHGKHYGSAGTTAPAQSTTHAAQIGATDGTNWANHPDWQEYQALSGPMKSAVRNDFRCFLFIKRRGGLANLAETVGSQIEREAAAQSTDQAKRAQEEMVEAAPVLEAARFASALAWAKGKKNYPGLQNQKVR